MSCDDQVFDFCALFGDDLFRLRSLKAESSVRFVHIYLDFSISALYADLAVISFMDLLCERQKDCNISRCSSGDKKHFIKGMLPNPQKKMSEYKKTHFACHKGCP